MSKKEKVYLKDTELWGDIDHEASKEQFQETYAKLDSLTHMSGKKLVWKCLVEGHSWRASIYNRSNGTGCPFCSGNLISNANRLSINNPELAREWDPDKNELTSYDVTVSSTKKAWWRCMDGHSWQAIINNRSKGHGCPFCSGRRVSDTNRLSINRPELVGEWDFGKNESTPYDVALFSNAEAWWKCSEGHSWRAGIYSRSKGHGCPFCSGHRLSDSNRLSINKPELVGEWDFGKNELTPHDVTVSSNDKAWWRCAEGHSWRARVHHRSEGHGCPKCAKRTSQIEKRFIEAFTERTEFSLTAHGLRLNQLTYASGRVGVEVDMIFYYNHHYLLVEYDGSYWHREKTELDTEKSRALLSLGDNILHARIRENDLPELDLAHDRFSQFQHSYHATESDSIEHTVKEIERWFRERIGE